MTNTTRGGCGAKVSHMQRIGTCVAGSLRMVRGANEQCHGRSDYRVRWAGAVRREVVEIAK